MRVMRVDTAKISGTLLLSALLGMLSCGPPLTQPSSVNLTDLWQSTDHIGPVFNIRMDVNQARDGTVSGQWSGMVTPPLPTCPSDLNTTAKGPVSGTNTVLAVQLSLLGVGDFQGQVIDAATLRGSLESCSHRYPVTFSRVGPAASG